MFYSSPHLWFLPLKRAHDYLLFQAWGECCSAPMVGFGRIKCEVAALPALKALDGS